MHQGKVVIVSEKRSRYQNRLLLLDWKQLAWISDARTLVWKSGRVFYVDFLRSPYRRQKGVTRLLEAAEGRVRGEGAKIDVLMSLSPAFSEEPDVPSVTWWGWKLLASACVEKWEERLRVGSEAA